MPWRRNLIVPLVRADSSGEITGFFIGKNSPRIMIDKIVFLFYYASPPFWRALSLLRLEN